MTKYTAALIVVATTIGCSGGRTSDTPQDSAMPDAALIDAALHDATTQDLGRDAFVAMDAADVVDATAVLDAADATTSVDATDATDAADAAMAEACNPLAAAGLQGCPAGQKCTWVNLAEDLGKLSCVPDGDVALGDVCTVGEYGEATGYDNCAAGAFCISGICRDICGFTGGPDSACASGFACTRYAGTFANGDDEPAAGACNPTCNPLTQTRGDGSSCGAGKGCYLLSSDTGTVGVCAGAGSSANVHNVQIRAAGATTPVYVNSCAPGYTPRSATQGTGAAIECAGYCRPAAVYADTPASGSTPARDGMNDGRSGRPNYEGGDTTFMNWRGLPATCANALDPSDTIGRAVVDPSNPTTGESCQFYYMNETYDGISEYSNAIGVCFQFRQWQYDSSPPTDGSLPVPDTAWPSCRDLTRGALMSIPEITDAAAYFGCTPLELETTSLESTEPPRPIARTTLHLDRLAPVR